MLQKLITSVKQFLFPAIVYGVNNELPPLPSEEVKAQEPKPEPFSYPWHALSTQEKVMRILDRNYQAMDENSYKPVSLLSRYQDWQNAETNEQRKIYFEILEDAVDYYLQYHSEEPES